MDDVSALLDPELRSVLADFQLPPLTTEGLAALRGTPFPRPPLSDGVQRTEHIVPSEPPVPVRVHRAGDVDGLRPAVVSMHGGGLVIGTYDTDDALFDAWCPRFGIVGVSVEYRLAPESPYPGPLDDCYAALQWTHEHAEELGIDRDRIGLRGISAGAGLAAGLALLARDRGEVPVAFQLLDAPMLDDRQVTPSSQVDGLLVWSRQANTFGWRAYLGDRFGTDDVPEYAAAARAVDLSELPPAFVSVGAIDGFRDEAVDYAQRLNQAGVPCELHVYPGLPHGYGLVPHAVVVQQAVRHMDEWLARQVTTHV